MKRSPEDHVLRLHHKIARNRVGALLRAAKRRYFFNQFNQRSKNPRKTWSLVNSLRGKKRSNCSVFQSFREDPIEIADAFNRAFRNVPQCSHLVDGPCTLKESLPSSAFLPRLSKSDLKSIVFSFSSNKPAGCDGMSIDALRRNFEALSGLFFSY